MPMIAVGGYAYFNFGCSNQERTHAFRMKNQAKVQNTNMSSQHNIGTHHAVCHGFDTEGTARKAATHS
eukprot:3255846-Amphidinium_carterae.1